MDAIASAVALGFILGLQHATDADHLVAVATIVSRERRFAGGALIGALWGLGHMTTLTAAGAIVVGLHLTVSPRVGAGLEWAVALMLVVLGVLRLRDTARGADSVPPAHLATEHDHGGAATLHSHPHSHGGHEHRHPHVHPSRPLLAALGGRRRALGARALAVGAVHGMAGTGAVALLVLATLPGPLSAVLYMVVFGVGTMAGMTLLTAAMAYPVSLAVRFGRARSLLTLGAGAGSIAFGLFYAVRLL